MSEKYEAAALQVQLEQMRRNPSYEVRDRLDRLLVDHFFACWPRVQCIEMESLRSAGESPEDQIKRTRLFGLAQSLLMNAMQAIRIHRPLLKRVKSPSVAAVNQDAAAAAASANPAERSPPAATTGTTPAPGTIVPPPIRDER